MRAGTLATLVSASLVLTPAVATADSPAAKESPAVKSFRAFITKNAAETDRYVEAWWEANLDADAGLERVALICDIGGDDRKGYFILEKDEAHRPPRCAREAPRPAARSRREFRRRVGAGVECDLGARR